MRLPVVIEAAEFRGLAGKSGEFVNRDGEKIAYSDKLRFEYEDDDGTVQVLDVAASQLDKVAEFDCSTLRKGETVRLAGSARDGDRGAYFALSSVTRKAAVKAA